MSSSISTDVLPDDRPHYTEHRPVLCGSFNISNAEIPFFQGILPLKSVVDELDLVENLPSDLRAKWRLEELFQREIDWERVRKELVDEYLRRPGKLKFFSTLTVALIPKQPDGMLDSSYGDTPNPPAPINGADAPSWSTTNIGGVQLVRNARSPNGYVRWDPKRVFAATIDGQHRLAALRMMAQAGNLPSKTLDTKLSVMFLILDERAGFSLGTAAAADDENPILTVVREIFIDLNMNARTVARARKILLADQDIEARCLREVIATRIGAEEEGRLPLGLIHWQHNESAKFNIGEKTGPFLTTVELLYLIIQDVLDLKRPKDPSEDTEVRKFVKSIEDSLTVSKFIAAHDLRFPGLKPLLSYVEEHYLKEGYEAPFANPTPPYIRACAESFAETWRPIFLDVLTKFKPYATFINEVRAEGGIDGDIAHYLVQPIRAQQAQAQEWGEDRPRLLDEPLRRLHKLKDGEWAFLAVFQKALFRATKIAYQHYEILPDRGEVSFREAWISFLNTLADQGLFKVRHQTGSVLLWAGIGLNPAGGTVNWSEASAQRIAALLVVWWYFHSYKLKNAKQFISKLGTTQAAAKFPQGKELANSIRRGLQSLVRARGEELEADEITERVEKRLRELVALALSSRASDEADADVGKMPTGATEQFVDASAGEEADQAVNESDSPPT